ncbi:MAG: hypothetical protein AAB152_13770 [Candidatus Coatesbacteria bacterium]
MRFGTAYMGNYYPEAIKSELTDIAKQGFDEVILTCQENDFHHFTGKVEFTPRIAHDLGLKVLVNLWGYASAFGGGRISRLVADHPEVMVVDEQGQPRPSEWPAGYFTQPGCPNHPKVASRAQEHCAAAIKAGADGFFWDEPTKFNCYCTACRACYAKEFGGDLATAPKEKKAAFRQWSVAHWVEEMSRWVKAQRQDLVTSTCVMPSDRDAWEVAAGCPSLDSLGTDAYWEFEGRPLEWIREPSRALVDLARQKGKSPHLWLQCWKVHRGPEPEIAEAAKILGSLGPDTLYVWAYRGQLGTTETCEDPLKAWKFALQGLHAAGMKPR